MDGISAIVVREGGNALSVGVERNRANYFADTLVADSKEIDGYVTLSNEHLA